MSFTVEWSVLDVKADSPREAVQYAIDELLAGRAPLIDVLNERGEFIEQVGIEARDGRLHVTQDGNDA